ncbi:hypothetical protein [Thioalkalivibrio sp. HK1]|uniref:hypothetical protein n=1 Tax=Thioalkalivibrio sp. HK1 TaxID=1469245 RepID=UPI0004AFF993|nr:hypothetical protein [Thioalkalivibrio sp. HK1]
MANRRRGQQPQKAGAPRKLKMTVARKIKAIVRVIQGEPMDLVARSFNVTAADVGC